jgi:hypothetical protein
MPVLFLSVSLGSLTNGPEHLEFEVMFDFDGINDVVC